MVAFVGGRRERAGARGRVRQRKMGAVKRRDLGGEAVRVTGALRRATARLARAVSRALLDRARCAPLERCVACARASRCVCSAQSAACCC